MSAQIAVLGLLVERPLHGYGIAQLIEQRGMRSWTSIGFSSIYQLLDHLVADGLAEVRLEPAPGRGKERRVHTVTAAGRDLWERKTLLALSDVATTGGDFLLALSGLPLLDWEEARAALEHRLEQLGSQIDDLDRDNAAVRPVPEHVEAMFDHTRSQLTAERDWLERFLTNQQQKPPTETS